MVIIGREIKDELKRQHRTVVWLAEQLSCNRSNVYKIFNKTSIDTHELMRISRILNRDFFELYHDELTNNWTTQD